MVNSINSNQLHTYQLKANFTPMMEIMNDNASKILHLPHPHLVIFGGYVIEVKGSIYNQVFIRVTSTLIMIFSVNGLIN